MQSRELHFLLFGLQGKSKLYLVINFSVVLAGILSELGTLTELLRGCQSLAACEQ